MRACARRHTRQFSLTLTKKRHTAATLSAQIATDFIVRMMSVLSAQERAVLDTALEKMIALMHEDFDGATAR